LGYVLFDRLVLHLYGISQSLWSMSFSCSLDVHLKLGSKSQEKREPGMQSIGGGIIHKRISGKEGAKIRWSSSDCRAFVNVVVT